MMHDQHLKPALPDTEVISKAMSRAMRKRMGLTERLSPEELKDRRRGAANDHAKRKAKRKRQRTSTRRNRASAKRKR